MMVNWKFSCFMIIVMVMIMNIMMMMFVVFLFQFLSCLKKDLLDMNIS